MLDQRMKRDEGCLKYQSDSQSSDYLKADYLDKRRIGPETGNQSEPKTGPSHSDPDKLEVTSSMVDEIPSSNTNDRLDDGDWKNENTRTERTGLPDRLEVKW